MSQTLVLKSNAHALAADINDLADHLQGVNYGKARDAMSEIADMLVGSVRETMLSQAFTPLSPVTVEYKQRKGLDSRILFASGRAFAGLVGHSGATWARAYRGLDDWWMFLHDKGVGVAQWSREGEDRSGAAAKRRHRNRKQMSEGRIPLTQLGYTRFPKRQMFVITAGAETSILSRYDLFLQTACDEVGQ